MTYAALLVNRELLKAYIPQLYKPIAFLIRFLARETSLFILLGLAADPSLRNRRMPIRRVGPALLEDEEEEDDDQLLSAESLMPAPVDRFKRVSASFLTRHDLIDEELEEGLGLGTGAEGEDDGSGGERKGPSFVITFNAAEAYRKRGLTSGMRSQATRLAERGKLREQR